MIIVKRKEKKKVKLGLHQHVRRKLFSMANPDNYSPLQTKHVFSSYPYRWVT